MLGNQCATPNKERGESGRNDVPRIPAKFRPASPGPDHTGIAGAAEILAALVWPYGYSATW
jgi:hypothetical protein